jgi:Prp8 binding protein
MAEKRKSHLLHSSTDSRIAVYNDGDDQNKRRKTTNELVLDSTSKQIQIASGPKRTSSLKAPIMMLQGHKSEVYTARFSPNGAELASGSFDKTILLWSIYGDCENYAQLRGHNNAVLEVTWSQDGKKLYSASADKSIMGWDVERAKRLRRYRDHEAVVNCVTTGGQNLVAGGSDDRTVKIYDDRSSNSICSLACRYPVMSVSFSSSGDRLFTAGVEGTIRQWDIRKQTSDDTNVYEATLQMQLQGHHDSITGISLSPDGTSLLSTSMDNTCRIWDIRPYSRTPQRNTAILVGAQHNIDKNLLRCSWSPSGKLVASGSSDSPSCHVYIWDSRTSQLIYKLPGHKGTVNQVDFHPKEPIIVSAGSDGVLFLGEIDNEVY